MNFPPNGLVLYAPLWHPELSGSPFNAWDIANGGVHSCTVVGATWTPDGRLFSGGDDYLDLGNILNFGTGDFSIAFWVNVLTDTDGVVIAKGRHTGAGDILIYCYPNLSFRNNNQTGDEYTYFTDTTVTGIGWFHGVLTREGATTKAYFNGVLNDTSTIETSYDFTNTHKWTIGAREDGTESFLDGYVGEVLMYDKALTAAEIRNIYYKTKGRYV